MSLSQKARLFACGLAVGAATLLVTSQVHASVLAEWDFRNQTNPQNLSVSAGTTGATVNGATGPTFNPTGTAVGTGDPRIATGYMDASGGGLHSNDTYDLLSTPANEGTIVMVLQKKALGTGRFTFFSQNVQLSNEMWLFWESGNLFFRVAGNGLYDVNIPTADSSLVNNWYLLIATWKEGTSTQLYARAIGSASGTSASHSLASGLTGTSVPLYVGERHSGIQPTDTVSEFSPFKIAFVQVLNTQTTDFDAYYNALTAVPEPASFGLLGFGLLALGARRRG